MQNGLVTLSTWKNPALFLTSLTPIIGGKITAGIQYSAWKIVIKATSMLVHQSLCVIIRLKLYAVHLIQGNQNEWLYFAKKKHAWVQKMKTANQNNDLHYVAFSFIILFFFVFEKRKRNCCDSQRSHSIISVLV